MNNCIFSATDHRGHSPLLASTVFVLSVFEPLLSVNWHARVPGKRLYSVRTCTSNAYLSAFQPSVFARRPRENMTRPPRDSFDSSSVFSFVKASLLREPKSDPRVSFLCVARRCSVKPRLVGRIWSLFFRLYCLGFDPLCIFRVLNKEKKIAEVAKISSPSSKIGEQLP